MKSFHHLYTALGLSLCCACGGSPSRERQIRMEIIKVQPVPPANIHQELNAPHYIITLSNGSTHHVERITPKVGDSVTCIIK